MSRHKKGRGKPPQSGGYPYRRHKKVAATNGGATKAPQTVAPTTSNSQAKPAPALIQIKKAESKPQVNVPAQLLPAARPPRVNVNRGERRMNKNIRFELMEMFGRCNRKFIETVRGRRGVQSVNELVAKAVGKAIEQALAVDDRSERDRVIAQHLQQVPQEEQSEARRRVYKAIRVAKELYGEPNAVKQAQFWWTDPETGWTLWAKPDVVEYLHQSDGSWLVRVIDDKHSSHASCWHKRQIRFFLLVIKSQLDEQIAQAQRLGQKRVRYNLEGVIRLLGEQPIDPAEDEAGQSVEHAQTKREIPVPTSFGKLHYNVLPAVRQTCRDIEAAFGANAFPAKTGWDCERCPHRLTCPAFAPVQMQAREQKDAGDMSRTA